jgi:hypothetical protein
VIFQNPIAWLGLAAIAVPIVVHLLGRRRARRLPFPTLRFVPASPLPPVRRDRLTDAVLLLVRAATIAAAAVALAQPLWLTGARAIDVERALSRAVIVDTSASMDRLAPGGERAIDRARRDAAALTTEATASRVIDAASPANALPGTIAWIQAQSGRAEIVVVSDFQPDAIERADLDRVPAGIGIRLVAVPIAGPAPALPNAVTPLKIVAGPAEQPRADAALAAVRQISGEWKGRADRPIAIVFPGAPDRQAIVAAARPIDQPWMFDTTAAIGRNVTLADAAPRAPSPEPQVPAPAPGALTVLARAPDARPLVLAARGPIEGTDRLLLFLHADAGSVASAALMSAAASAAAAAAPASEVDPVVRPEAELRSWERAPSPIARPSTDPGGRSDGRWVWLAVLGLLGLEWMIRRAPLAVAAPVPGREEHERVA